MQTSQLEPDLERRAFAAFFRAGGVDQPSPSLTTVEEHAGRRYLVLRNVRGTLAIYRVLPSGVLRRMRRGPSALRAEVAA